MTVKAIGTNIKRPVIKTFGNTIKKSVNIFCRNKNTIKNLASGLQENQLRTRHNFGSKSIKYFREEKIRFFKYISDSAVRKSKWLFRIEDRKNIQMRSAAQVNGGKLRSVAKRSVEYIRGKELGSLINMVSKSKPQLPLLLVTGGLGNLIQFNQVYTKDFFGDDMGDDVQSDTKDNMEDFDTKEEWKQFKGMFKSVQEENWKKAKEDEAVEYYTDRYKRPPTETPKKEPIQPKGIHMNRCTFIKTNHENKSIYPRCLHIRKLVFQYEQKISEEVEIKGEKDSLHYLLTVDGKDAATARFSLAEDVYKIDKVAVLKDWRKKGVGKVLLECLIKAITRHRGKRKGTEKIMVHAQIPGLDFWKKINFIENGDQYEDTGIKHSIMYYNEISLNE